MENNIKASLLLIVFIELLKVLSKSNRVKKKIIAKCIGSCFRIVSLFNRIGLIMAATPNTNMELTMVEPTTLANTISLLPLKRLLNEINNSGVLVPKATIDKEIINLGIFRLLDVEAIPSTNRSAPFIKR
jgi:hypothetical protein